MDSDFSQLTLPLLILQSEPNDLVTVFNLSKIQAELIYMDGIFDSKVFNVTYRKLQQIPSSFFFKNGELLCFNDVE